MSRDLAKLCALLATDNSLSDYDLWRALRSLEDHIYQLGRARRPIPIRALFARRALREARLRRRARRV